jgi:Nucleotidyl transferase AbiEii toxin, Type IV TA system
VALLREEPDFDVALQRAGQALGDLDSSFVEKDYWVTQVLRTLSARYPHGFTLKGGTSLSKGYGIIERFSEDVDILVRPLGGASAKRREDHLEEMTATTVQALGLTWREQRAPGRGREAHRADLISYTATIEAAVRAGIEHDAVLLETGYAGGREPSEVVEITPLICSADINPAEFADTAPFEIAALEPRRTLVEKLFALHHLATKYKATETAPEERLGRHYYDIFQLLGHSPTIQVLKRGEEFEDLVGEVEQMSARSFGGTTPRPEEGFASSPAFQPGPSGPLRDWLEGLYEAARSLVPRQAGYPSFGEVLKRVEERAELL